MKSKGLAAIGLAVAFGAALWAQSGAASPDARKLRQELDVMKGILQTSLRYALEQPARSGVFFEQDIDAYYLPGQGAVFIVPIHLNGPAAGFPAQALEAYLTAAEGQRELSERVLRDLQREVERAARDASAAVEGMGGDLVWETEGEAPEPPGPPPAPDAPDAPEASPAPPPPPAPKAESGKRVVVPRVHIRVAENARERLDELRNRLNQQKEESEERRREREASFAKIRESMVEALSRHGDSLSILGPDESIALILKRDSGGLYFNGPMLAGTSTDKSGSVVLSVKKSDVTAYRSGRIDRAQFLNRVIESEQ